MYMDLHRKVKTQEFLSELGVWRSRKRAEGESKGKEESGEKCKAQIKTIKRKQLRSK